MLFVFHPCLLFMCALFVVPEQAGALLMPQNPSEQKDGDCPNEDTVQGRKQRTDTVPTARGKHGAMAASSSDVLVARLCGVTEELKKGAGMSEQGSGMVLEVVPSEGEGQRGRKVFAQVPGGPRHREERGEGPESATSAE